MTGASGTVTRGRAVDREFACDFVTGIAAGVVVVGALWDISASTLLVALTIAVFTTVTVRMSPSIRTELSAVWGVIAVGCAAQLSLDPTAPVAQVVGIGGIAFVVAHWVTRLAQQYRMPERIVTTLVPFALVVALAVRLLPATQDSLRNGRLDFGALSIQVGQFTQIVVLVAASALIWQALALVGEQASRRTILRSTAFGIVALAANLGLLLLVDTGPAMVTIGALAIVALTTARAMRVSILRLDLWAGVGVAVCVATVAAIQWGVTDRLDERFRNVLEPDYQLGVAREAMQQGGFIGAGLGTSPLAPSISLNASDFLPATIGAELGMGVLALIVTTLTLALSRIAVRVRGHRDLAGLITIGLMSAMVIQVVVTVAGTVGAIPLTGLSTPGLTVTGSTVVPTLVALGIASSVMGNAERTFGMSAAPRRIPVVVLAAAASLTCACLALAATSTSANGYSVLMPRGDILTRDGVVIATSNASGRVYPDGTLYSELGWMVPGYAAYGLESSGSDILTCGMPPTLGEWFLQLLRPIPCHPADLVTSIDSRLQVALSNALDGLEAQGTVVDSLTGEVLALYASPAGATTDDVPSQLSLRASAPPGSTFKLVTAAAALLLNVDPSGAPADEFMVGDSTITNSNRFWCSDPSIVTMIEESCNTTAAYLAVKTGQTQFATVAHDYFGADRDPAFDAGPAEPLSTGLQGSAVSDSQLARTGFGQESVQGTALSVATMTGIIAHSAAAPGTPVYAPHVSLASCSGSALTMIPAQPAFDGELTPLPQAVGATIVGAMTKVVEAGSAGALSELVDSRSVGLKTGTAEVVDSETGYSRLATVIVDSRWVVTIVVENASPDQASPAILAAASVVAQLPQAMLDPTCEG